MRPNLGARTVVKVADQKGLLALGSRYAGKHFAVTEETDGTAILTPVQLVPDKEQPLTARRLDETFTRIGRLEDNWDGQGSPAPSPSLVAQARELLALLHAGALARSLTWTDPHVGCNERGQITLEWWHGPRNLTVTVRDASHVDYLKSWGSDIESEMEDGEIERLSDFAELASWLNGPTEEAA